VVTGDDSQIDLPVQRRGLIDAEDLLRNVPDIGFVRLDRKDIVRHRLPEDRGATSSGPSGEGPRRWTR
jgi:phosphate starvation-inducible PhoH-like protein